MEKYLCSNIGFILLQNLYPNWSAEQNTFRKCDFSGAQVLRNLVFFMAIYYKMWRPSKNNFKKSKFKNLWKCAKSIEKRFKLRFLCNLWKQQTDFANFRFKINSDKPFSSIGYILCLFNLHLIVLKEKNLLNCDFCSSEAASNMTFEISWYFLIRYK